MQKYSELIIRIQIDLYEFLGLRAVILRGTYRSLFFSPPYNHNYYVVGTDLTLACMKIE